MVTRRVGNLKSAPFGSADGDSRRAGVPATRGRLTKSFGSGRRKAKRRGHVLADERFNRSRGGRRSRPLAAAIIRLLR